MPAQAFNKFCSEVKRATEAVDVWNSVVDAFHSVNVESVHYYFIANPADEVTKPFWFSTNRDFERLAEITNQHPYRSNPMITQSQKAGRAVPWREINNTQLTKAERRFLANRKAAGLEEVGITIPVYGPYGRVGFFSIASDPSETGYSDSDQGLLLALIHIAHRRICELIPPPSSSEVQLSNREHEAMTHMSRGCSNRDISEKMGVSVATVNTFTRRAFSKLNAADRVSAVSRFLLSSF